MPRRRSEYLLTSIGSLLLIAACADGEQATPPAASETADAFAGSQACQLCHADEYRAWTGSHHELAMQVADADSVLGDFDGASFEYFGSSTRFFRRDDRFVVRTRDDTGADRDFEITYTFGVEPLQQYLVAYPGGRLQALPFAWDTRSTEEGGQRWYHLYPLDAVLPGDPLHWTGLQHNWNYMCAECHSTNVKMRFDAASDTFATTFSEVSVGCEACHGPGSSHIEQAQRGAFDSDHGLEVNLDDRGRAVWRMNRETGIAERSQLPLRAPTQPEACGRCHSRRAPIAEEYAYGRPLADTHRVALLDEGLYEPDGQILDEVYVYGSFLQSKMYRAGVTCSDCHDPHSAELRTGENTNAVCSQCHLPERFASEAHHGEDPAKAYCVDCHMPSRLYMGVDERHDHSFVVPGRERGYADAFEKGRAGPANPLLIDTIGNREYPGIARATALTLLRAPLDRNAIAAVQSGLRDPDDLVRRGALRGLGMLPPDAQLELGVALLDDPVRSVRDEAVQLFAPFASHLTRAQKAAFNRAEAELRASQGAMLNRPEAWATLGTFEAGLGNIDRALELLTRALEMQPRSSVARVNLADVLRQSDNDERGEELLREGIALSPDSAVFHHALGLLLIRQQRYDEGVDELREAVRLEPENARYVYVLDVALQSDDAVPNELASDDEK